jgi:hypothetical protein
MKEIKETRWQAFLTLTGEESMRLQEISKKLKLSKGETVGLLIMKAQIIQTPGGKAKIADESLIVLDDLTDVTL